MADNQEHQQNQQGGAQERADAPEPAQVGRSTHGDATGAQEPPERDEVDLTDDVQSLRHEAASRRRALRQVEAERDQLKGRVDLLDRQEVERIVSPSLADASDLWGSVELAELRGEDGAITEEKVSEALAGLLKAKPHFAKPQHRVDLHQGARQEVAEPPSFGQALKSGGRR